MIATTLFGGLGNQMFIYAMTRAMSLKNGTDMVFNIHSGFKDDKLFQRKLELCNMNVQLKEHKILTFDYGIIAKPIKRLSFDIGHNIFASNHIMIKEAANTQFYPEIYQIKSKNIYLEGYWQSPKYFKSFEKEIREDFKFTVNIPSEIMDELRYWRSFNRPLVMVGVRRYQECKDANIDVTWGVCDSCFYRDAVESMKTKLVNPLFVIFSQDYDWCRENLPDADFIFAKKKIGGLASIYDLYLMVNCDSAIISNSSFYWWGAWLQKKSDIHFVIAPDNFLNKDQVCDEWFVHSAK